MKKFWDFISSTRAAVILMAVLVLVSIIGTVIPQNQSGDVYLRAYGQVFSSLFYALHLTDLFGSAFFKALLFLLGLSLAACSANRLLAALKRKSSLYSWGSFIAHLSALVIFAGAIYGSMNGFSAYIAIEKGSSHFEHRGNFYVRLNDFNAKFDVNGRALDFSSDLSVMDGGKEVLRRTIYVNRPLEYKGIRFYQSSYGLNGVLSMKGPDGTSQDLPIYKGGYATDSRTGLIFGVQEFFPDMKTLHGMSQEVFEPTSPVIFLTAGGNGVEEEVGWLIIGKPIVWKGFGLKLAGAKEYTGLQVKQDPGVPLVYLGLFLLSIGVCIMMYTKSRGKK